MRGAIPQLILALLSLPRLVSRKPPVHTMSGFVRQFVSAPSGAPDTHPDHLTFVSYNILAPKYATAGMFSYCPPNLLAMASRGPRIIQELLGFNADLICLQEVERPFYETELLPAMASRGYQALYLGRAVRPSDFIKGPEEGIALLYREARFSHVAISLTRLGDLVDPGARGQFWSRVADLQEGAIWAVLQDRQAGQLLLVGCTHLYWNPLDPDAKVAQAALLCKAGNNLLRSVLGGSAAVGAAGVRPTEYSLPVLLGGDFNSLPYKLSSDQFDTVPAGAKLVSGVYTLLSEGALGPEHPDHPSARRPKEAGELRKVTFTTSGLELHSMLAAAWGCDPPVTNKTGAFAGCLDYIWASPHWEAVQALAVPYRWQPGRETRPEEVTDLPALPNEDFPSDHLAIGARLALTAQRAR